MFIGRLEIFISIMKGSGYRSDLNVTRSSVKRIANIPRIILAP